MTNYKTLINKDICTLKNHLLEIKRDPKRLIIYLFYIIWIGSVVIGGISSARSQQMTNFKTTVGPQVIGSIFVGLVLTLLIFSIYTGTKESSTFFSMGDVHFLFPSPISPKKILLYSMIKTTIFYSAIYIFTTIALIPAMTNFAKFNFAYIPFTYFGFLSAVILIEPMKFLIFSVGTRYNIKSTLQRITIFFIVGFIVHIIGSIFYHDEIIKGVLLALNAPAIEYIPLIGWSKVVFMTPISGFSNYTIIALILETLLIVLCIYFTYKTADDYYEDVLGITEKKTNKKKRYKSGKNQLPKFLVRKNKDIEVKGKRKGPMALLWKSKVEYKRTDIHIYFSFMTILLLGLGIIVGIIGLSQEIGFELMFIANGFLAYMIFIFSISTAADHELSKPYIYLIPGSTSKKMVAVHLLDVIRMTINAIVFNVALGIILKASILNTVVLIVFIMSFYILNISSNFIVRVIFPNKVDRKVLTLFFLLIQFLFIILPGAIGGVIGLVIFDTPQAFFIGVVIINLIEISAMLMLSNVIFKNVEWM